MERLLSELGELIFVIVNVPTDNEVIEPTFLNVHLGHHRRTDAQRRDQATRD